MNVLRKVVSRETTTAASRIQAIRWHRPRQITSSSFVTRTSSTPSTLHAPLTLWKAEPTTHVTPSTWNYRHGHLATVNRRHFSTEDISPLLSLSPEHTAILHDSNHRIQACALQGDAVQAQEILEQLETLLKAAASSSSSSQAAVDDSLLESREAVLDAWIAYQTTLIQQDENDPQAIVQAAKYAHQALEQTVPFLKNVVTTTERRRRTTTTLMDETILQEDDPVLLGSTKKQTTAAAQLFRCNAVLSAWARASRVASTRQGIPQRATHLLQRMETNHNPNPTTESYNRVLEAWAYSSEHLRGTMAEQIFQTLKRKRRNKDINSSSKKSAKDSIAESEQWIIHAWCKSQQKKAAANATKHLTTWLKRLEKRRETVEPTVETYQMVLEAWITAEDKIAPIKALEILRTMETALDRSFCSTEVDETCYKNYLLASAQRSQLPEQGQLADQILTKLKNQQVIPDQDFYTAAIQIWKNSALNPLFADTRDASVARAVELLQELSVAHHRSSLVSIQPTTQNYNDALEALSASRKPISRDIAETLVKVMEDSTAKEGKSTDIQPDADTYKWLLSVHAASRAPDKVPASKEALERMKGAFAEEDEASREALVDVYNTFIRVCASADSEDGSDYLQEALGAAAEMRSLYGLKPNSQTYANLLRVCKAHLEVGAERTRIVEYIFEGCCEEGLVNNTVLKSLQAATSEGQYFNLVVAVSEGEEGTRIVPKEWTANAGVDGKVAASGRIDTAAPLTVEGRFTVTTAMKEARMRKLRSKRNQRTLRGGRLKIDRKTLGEPIIIQLDEEALAKANLK